MAREGLLEGSSTTHDENSIQEDLLRAGYRADPGRAEGQQILASAELDARALPGADPDMETRNEQIARCVNKRPFVEYKTEYF